MKTVAPTINLSPISLLFSRGFKLSSIFNKRGAFNFSSNSFSDPSSPKMEFKKSAVIITSIALVALIIAGGASVLANRQNSTSNSDSKFDVQKPKASITLSKDFSFPLKNDKGEEIGKIKYTLENAELRDEIVVKGQKAVAVKGRIFLIVNLKIVNDSSQGIQINTRDYVRLSMNNNEKELLAPDIHNDPVEVQAISTKPTRLGFSINESDKNLKLHIGEIKGDKTTVDIKFR